MFPQDGSVFFHVSNEVKNIFEKMYNLRTCQTVHGHGPDSLIAFRLRPYYVEYTGSRPITEVKQRRARSVLRWETAWEYRVS